MISEFADCWILIESLARTDPVDAYIGIVLDMGSAASAMYVSSETDAAREIYRRFGC